MANLSIPPESPILIQGNQLSTDWRVWLTELVNKVNTKADAQSDVDGVTAVTVVSGSDTIDMSALQASLTLLKNEINAMATSINDLVDKLQAAGVMDNV